MSMYVALQRDAKELDHGPIFDFCQWARKYDDPFGITDGHYDRPDCGTSVLDLGTISDNLEEVLENWDEQCNVPKPPNILEYLNSLMTNEKIYHCWVSW